MLMNCDKDIHSCCSRHLPDFYSRDKSARFDFCSMLDGIYKRIFVFLCVYNTNIIAQPHKNTIAEGDQFDSNIFYLVC